LPYSDDHFDCAALVDVLHHLTGPVPVLEETARVLRPSGILMLADFSAEGFELVARVYQEEGREHPVSGVTLASAEAFLSRRGFELTVRFTGHKHDVVVLRKKTGTRTPGQYQGV
jgi:ubiquinone/menaquinone biosynthesis C-methylase UbiE